jgi:hypothetical protein
MLCQKCGKYDACVHVTDTSGPTGCHFCEACAKETLSTSVLAHERWKSVGEGTKGLVHATVRIENIDKDSITGRVLKSSVYPSGSALTIRICFVSEEQRRVGSEFTFTCSADFISEVIMKEW